MLTCPLVDMSRKRQREKSAVNTELVEIYDDLANEDGSIRLKAAHSLLTKFVSGPEKDDGQLGKILQRLLRGLCSGRKAARIGFSIALTEFLTELLGSSKRVPPPFQDILGVIGELKNQTTITSGVSGQVSLGVSTTIGNLYPNVSKQRKYETIFLVGCLVLKPSFSRVYYFKISKALSLGQSCLVLFLNWQRRKRG